MPRIQPGKQLAMTLADYLMPTANRVPPVQVPIAEDAPSLLNRLGGKSVGDAGINPMGAAIAARLITLSTVPARSPTCR